MSNSFYQDGKLYQINTSKSELLLDIKDFNSDQTLKTIRVLSEDDKRSNWLKALKDDNVLPLKDQYRLVNWKKSTLTHVLNL